MTNKFKDEIYIKEESPPEEQVEEIMKGLESSKLQESKENNVKLNLITMLKKFVKSKRLLNHIEKTISDTRLSSLIVYPKESIIMGALCLFLFKMSSGNQFDEKSHDKDEKYSRKNIAKFIGAPEDRVPVIKTIEKFLKNLEEGSINDLMIEFFKDLLKSKFFKQHPEIAPADFFLLAADCVHTHTYDHPHHTNKEGVNDCPYCLKRVYNKGTKDERVKYLHNLLVFSFVFLGKLKIPIYSYPIHAKQVTNLESVDDKKYKQECELVGLKESLPRIKEAFPRMKIVLLLDGLYANEPVIQLANELGFGYMIVRKEGCLTSLGKDCDGLAKLPNHRKNCTKKLTLNDHGCKVIQQYEWFNSMELKKGFYNYLIVNKLRSIKSNIEQQACSKQLKNIK